MKKIAYALIALLMIVSLAGCGKKTNTAEAVSPDVDVDLTKLSSTMVYSEVYMYQYSHLVNAVLE